MTVLAFHIDTPDGGGEATRESASAPWRVSVPSGDFRHYGTPADCRRRVREFVGGPVTFPTPAEAADLDMSRRQDAYHGHPSHPTTCLAYREHYGRRCVCEDYQPPVEEQL